MRSAPWLLLIALAGCNLAPPHERPPGPHPWEERLEHLQRQIEELREAVHRLAERRQ